jgi:hypothetical protein
MAFWYSIQLNKVLEAGNVGQIHRCYELSFADKASTKKLDLQKKVATFFVHKIYSKVVIGWWFIKFVVLHICSINHLQMHSLLHFNLQVSSMDNFSVYRHRILDTIYLNLIPSYICSLKDICHWLCLVWY